MEKGNLRGREKKGKLKGKTRRERPLDALINGFGYFGIYTVVTNRFSVSVHNLGSVFESCREQTSL